MGDEPNLKGQAAAKFLSAEAGEKPLSHLKVLTDYLMDDILRVRQTLVHVQDAAKQLKMKEGPEDDKSDDRSPARDGDEDDRDRDDDRRDDRDRDDDRRDDRDRDDDRDEECRDREDDRDRDRDDDSGGKKRRT